MAKVKFGHMPCESCGERVVVKENEHGTLSYGCDECEGVGYAKKGTVQHALWQKKIERVAAPAPAASPKPASAAAPKAEPKPEPVKPKRAPGSLIEAAGS